MGCQSKQGLEGDLHCMGHHTTPHHGLLQLHAARSSSHHASDRRRRMVDGDARGAVNNARKLQLASAAFMHSPYGRLAWSSSSSSSTDLDRRSPERSRSRAVIQLRPGRARHTWIAFFPNGFRLSFRFWIGRSDLHSHAASCFWPAIFVVNNVCFFSFLYYWMIEPIKLVVVLDR